MIETLLRGKGIRRVLCIVLCLSMCISFIPSTVFAAGGHTHEGTIVTEGTLSPYYSCSCGKYFKNETCTIDITDWLDEYKNTIYDVQISIEEPVLGGFPSVAVVGDSSLYTCEGVWSRMPDGYPEYTGTFAPGTYYYCFNVTPINPEHKISSSAVYLNGENLTKYTGIYPYHVEFQVKHICTGTLVTTDTLRPYYSCECGKFYEDEACTKEIAETDLENWRTLIDDVQITVAAPTLGGTPQVAVVGDSSLYTCEGVWSRMRDGYPEFTGTFEPGTYYYCFNVKPVNPDHKINTYDVYLNGENLDKYSGTYPYRMEFEVKHICAGTLVTADTLRPYYSCECGKYYKDEACTQEIAEKDLANWRTLIDDVQITVAVPTLGGTPQVAVVGDSSLYTCEGVWSRMPDGYPEHTGTFAPGTYYYCFNVTPVNPDHIISSYGVYLNGEKLEKYSGTYPYRMEFEVKHICTGTLVTTDTLRPYYSCECGKFYEDEACTKEIAEKDLENWRTLIDDVQITVAAPTLGGTPQVAVVGDSSLYTCEGVWSRMPDGYPEYTGTFAPGTYYYCFNVTPVNPDHIISSYGVYLNGEKLEKYSGTYPYRAKFTIEHTCTGTLVTTDTLRPYYSCECGKFYEDEACTKEIAETDLENWRTLIDDVQITVVVPAPGEKPQVAVVGDSSLYTCIGVWSTFADGTGAVEDIFSSNTDYYYCFDIQPVNPKNTISSTGVYLNGENLEKYSGTYPYRVKFNSGDCKHTNITPVEKVDATCKDAGKKAYVKCNGCNQYFEDADCKVNISDIGSWGIIPKTNTHVLPDKWNSSTDTHWGYCKVCGESISEPHDLITKEIENTKPTFDEDGVIKTETACSKCSYSTSHTEILPAEKYIRESQATMTPAAITKVMCGNDLTFESADSSKYTVKLGRIIDLTDSSIYPNDKKFIAGHKYAIEVHFYAVAPYEYNETSSTHSSTFLINGNKTDISAAVSISGSTYRRITLIAEDVEHIHKGGTATCINKAVCELCGEEYGEVNPTNHDFSKYVSNDNGTHKVVCKDCGAVQEGHDKDACTGNPCSKCNAKTAPTGVEGFCERLYTCALGRASDPAGVKSWVDAIKGGADGAKAARGFFFSDEFINKKLDNKEYVTRLYKTFMDREPDAAGLNAWVEALEKGASREKVFDGFVNSQEWANICFKYGIKSGGTATPSIRLEPSAEILAFAERLYTTCLGRDADPSGLKAWADALANREGSGAKVARGFFFSEEFINKKYDNGEFVRRCYLTFMDREPDAAGYNAWVKALNEGASREKVFDGFTQSPEFVAICEKAGIIAFG